MKIAVLGGCGIQGRTAVYDLARSPEVEQVICADADLSGLELIRGFTDMKKVRPLKLDLGDDKALVNVLAEADAAIDMLPRSYMHQAARAAVEAGTGIVNTNYGAPVRPLDEKARRAGVAVMPECGLDPGIDLVLYGHAADVFDELHTLKSYCGGFPEKAACDNPLNYKISWIWEGVLASSKRPGRMITEGRVVDIPAKRQHDIDLVHEVDFPGLGTLEAIPNGDAVFFTDLMGVTESIRETGRYALRWPGWSEFWRPLKWFGFLDDEPVEGLPAEVSPIDFLDKLMGPQLQYQKGERDLVAMYNLFEGLSGGRRIRMTNHILLARDEKTQLMAMSMGVGFPASIVAQMMAAGQIAKAGVLSPVTDIPYQAFADALAARGVVIKEVITEIID